MLSKSKKVFVDSSILLSFIDRSDTNHTKAVKALDAMAKNKCQLYTSPQIIQDVYALVSREIGISVALDFLKAILQSDMEILFPQKAELITSYKLIRTNRDRQLTLREALTATLMQKRGINQILTFSYWHNLFGTHVSSFSLQ